MSSEMDAANDLITILHSIALGDEKAIQTFYHEFYNSFISYGHTITQDRHAIEDAIQQLLIWMVENPRKARKLDRPDVYFYRSLRNNLVREQMKSGGRMKEKLQDAVQGMLTTRSAETKWMETEEEQEISKNLQREISNLPQYLQQILYLRYFSNMEYKDISEIMEIKPNVARIYIHRAIERLRVVFKEKKTN